MMHAPQPMAMSKEEALIPAPGVMIQQLTNECCRCFTCQPNIHWTVHDYADNFDPNGPKAPTKMWVKEEAAYCGRVWSCCAPGCRPTKYTVFSGPEPPEGSDYDKAPPQGPALMTHEKGCTCGQNVLLFYGDNGPVRCPLCFFLPYLATKDTAGQVIGTSKYICDMCLFVPKFSIENGHGQEVYKLRPETCMGGLCVRCKCGGAKGKACRVPFYIRDPRTMDPVDGGAASIVDLWAGWAKECCTRKNVYQVKFPAGADPNMKATLLGATLLVDLVLYEQDQ